jgi:hypothetical protein
MIQIFATASWCRGAHGGLRTQRQDLVAFGLNERFRANLLNDGRRPRLTSMNGRPADTCVGDAMPFHLFDLVDVAQIAITSRNFWKSSARNCSHSVKMTRASASLAQRYSSSPNSIPGKMAFAACMP